MNKNGWFIPMYSHGYHPHPIHPTSAHLMISLFNHGDELISTSSAGVPGELVPPCAVHGDFMVFWYIKTTKRDHQARLKGSASEMPRSKLMAFKAISANVQMSDFMR